MKTVKPTITKSLRALLEADFTVQIQNYKSLLIVLFIPLILLFAWHRGKAIIAYGDTFLIAIAITVALLGIGLTSYPISIARDRDIGIFQRLRITPTPSWEIMVSKIIVQLILCMVSVTVAVIGGSILYNISFSPISYIILFFAAFFSGALFLSIGQIIVGLIKSLDTINAVSRFIYIPTFLLGMFGELGILGTDIQNIVKWSPFGVVEELLISAMNPSTWSNTSWIALLVTIGYIIVFATIGIRLFQWDSR